MSGVQTSQLAGVQYGRLFVGVDYILSSSPEVIIQGSRSLRVADGFVTEVSFRKRYRGKRQQKRSVVEVRPQHEHGHHVILIPFCGHSSRVTKSSRQCWSIPPLEYTRHNALHLIRAEYATRTPIFLWRRGKESRPRPRQQWRFRGRLGAQRHPETTQ